MLIREVDVATRANLDYAAYHANSLIADVARPGVPEFPMEKDHKAPFTGFVETATLTGDIAETSLTEDERARALAFAPVLEWTTARRIRGAELLGQVGAEIRAEIWGGARETRVPLQTPSELYIHATDSRPELWVKVEFQPRVKAFEGLPDQDGDGVPELYGRVARELVRPEIVSAIQGDYARAILSSAEIVAWGHQLSSAWFSAFNADLLPARGIWPDELTEPEIKRELHGRVYVSPSLIIRGLPRGEPIYNVFIIKRSAAAP